MIECPIVATTSELSWDAATGVVSIDTARTQSVVGFVGGRTLSTKDVEYRMTTPFAVVMVSSLTADPIATSVRLLISTSADARWSGVDVSDAGDKVCPRGGGRS